jgi:hypothetical protein
MFKKPYENDKPIAYLCWILEQLWLHQQEVGRKSWQAHRRTGNQNVKQKSCALGSTHLDQLLVTIALIGQSPSYLLPDTTFYEKNTYDQESRPAKTNSYAYQKNVPNFGKLKLADIFEVSRNLYLPGNLFKPHGRTPREIEFELERVKGSIVCVLKCKSQCFFSTLLDPARSLVPLQKP